MYTQTYQLSYCNNCANIFDFVSSQGAKHELQYMGRE